MKRFSILLTLVPVIVLLLTGCDFTVFPEHYVVAVHNEASAGIVASVAREDEGGERYFAVRPAQEVIVDTGGHMNPIANRVRLYDVHCIDIATIEESDDSFANGARLDVQNDGTVDVVVPFTSSKSRPGPDDGYGESSCERAATLLDVAPSS